MVASERSMPSGFRDSRFNVKVIGVWNVELRVDFEGDQTDNADGGVREVDAVGVPRQGPVVLGEAHPHLVEPGLGLRVEC